MKQVRLSWFLNDKNLQPYSDIISIVFNEYLVILKKAVKQYKFNKQCLDSIFNESVEDFRPHLYLCNFTSIETFKLLKSKYNISVDLRYGLKENIPHVWCLYKKKLIIDTSYKQFGGIFNLNFSLKKTSDYSDLGQFNKNTYHLAELYYYE